MMICRQCGFGGDDVQDFISTDEPGERLCPICGSDECYIKEDDGPDDGEAWSGGFAENH